MAAFILYVYKRKTGNSKEYDMFLCSTKVSKENALICGEER